MTRNTFADHISLNNSRAYGNSNRIPRYWSYKKTLKNQTLVSYLKIHSLPTSIFEWLYLFWFKRNFAFINCIVLYCSILISAKYWVKHAKCQNQRWAPCSDFLQNADFNLAHLQDICFGKFVDTNLHLQFVSTILSQLPYTCLAAKILICSIYFV